MPSNTRSGENVCRIIQKKKHQSSYQMKMDTQSYIREEKSQNFAVIIPRKTVQ